MANSSETFDSRARSARSAPEPGLAPEPAVPPSAGGLGPRISGGLRALLARESKVSEELAMSLLDRHVREREPRGLWPLSALYRHTLDLLRRRDGPYAAAEAAASRGRRDGGFYHVQPAGGGRYELDLHGCTAIEARVRVRLAMDELRGAAGSGAGGGGDEAAPSTEGDGELHIVTGRGDRSGSDGAPAPLQSSVLALLAEQRVAVRRPGGNVGRLVVPWPELQSYWRRSEDARMAAGLRNLLALQVIVVMSAAGAAYLTESLQEYL
eukprot:CAMPEP_0118851200 /NCGR_PEP_ID=MMETSP1163-20130328/734_1 /TAXON_ID=124430 /ORGANISM="Phaeomonas parva, Strain CCMP2877" /LENGTH=266 /DNA_ID=CAMNT_0006783499 /DNA_START=1 /DNA_END=801 /DNA_ORIENTATION=+